MTKKTTKSYRVEQSSWSICVMKISGIWRRSGAAWWRRSGAAWWGRTRWWEWKNISDGERDDEISVAEDDQEDMSVEDNDGLRLNIAKGQLCIVSVWKRGRWVWLLLSVKLFWYGLWNCTDQPFVVLLLRAYACFVQKKRFSTDDYSGGVMSVQLEERLNLWRLLWLKVYAATLQFSLGLDTSR